jgi:RNA polymerase sigma factor for flagellar operon FliA
MDWGQRWARRQTRRIEQARQTLIARLGRVPGEVDVAVELNISLKEFQHLLGKLHGLHLVSLYPESFETQTEKEVNRYLPGAVNTDPFSLCLQQEMKSLIASALSDFDKKERQVLNLYYLNERTMKEISEVLGVAQSRVSQIHSTAITRLRRKVENLLRTRNKVTRETPALDSDLREPV